MVEIRKKENESTGSLLRRFSKAMQLSGFLTRARGTRYKIRPKSAYAKKREALRRVNWEKDMQKQRKLGKIE